MMPTFNAMPMIAKRFIWIPPSLNEEKKPGPTCIPIENMKRINPNSLKKFKTSVSAVYPKCPNRIPTKRTNVTPSDTPNTLILPK